MSLIKTSLLNSVAVVTKLATTLFLNKILAVYVGPAGYAVIGQFLNIVGVVTTFASGALNTGVTKYTAEYFDDEARQKTVWRTAGTISIVATLLLSILIAIFHKKLALLGLKRADLGHVFLWFAGSLLFFVLNNLLLAIMNGKKEVKGYVTVNIIGSFSSAALAGFLALKWGLEGALVALMVNQSLTFIVVFVYCRRTTWFTLKGLWGKIDPVIAINLGKYSLMYLSALLTPFSEMFVRNHLGVTFGWEAAGHWQAVSKISDTYLMLISSSLSLYYLPRLSEIRVPEELKIEIWNGYKIVLPVVIACAGVIYLSRDLIIKLLFTTSFLPMRELFAWQMIGDVVKISSWLLAYLMICKSMTRAFIITQVIFSSFYVLFVLFFTAQFGLKGSVIAYFANYMMYFIMVFFIVKKLFTSVHKTPKSYSTVMES